ncbi:MAG: TauD/TfdA family dioxygenase [Rhodospirillaceae bacterium]|jgi:alpha-ketoglutarate-dependent taurine dioxygenase|nr:TauD/TfdA family dioxygenase [Rhodospirillaceae bacterium]MBT5812024.1 TauD/TfdA family dioxygenase [Rhodospirillaceae bacterium]
MTLEITPCNATLGAVVRGVNLSQTLDEPTFAAIESAWHEYAVLIFPEQHLSHEEHREFTRRFGPLELSIRRTRPKTTGRLSNVQADGTVAPPESLQARFLVGNTYWHSDSSYKRVGAKASILAAHVTPSEGGETEWADMRAAYDVLDDDMKAYLEDKTAVHSYEFSHAPFGGMEVLNEEELAHLTPVAHPVIRTHPATGRKNIFAGRHASHILGEDIEESRKLLADLTNQAGLPPRTYKHAWKPGDLVMWDNRCVLHRGHRWPDDQPRTMVRTTVAGDGMDDEWLLETA